MPADLTHDNEVIEALGRNPVFGVLDERTRSLLAARCRRHEYRKNEVVFVQDEPGARLYVIVRGTVKIYRRSAKGDVMELVRRGEGELFGELALLDDGPRTASVETVVPSTIVSIGREVFVGLLEREPATVAPLLGLLGRIVRESTQLSSDLVFLDLRGRVASCLLRLDERAGGRGELTRHHRVSQTELARMVGAARQTVNGVLHQLQAEGCIDLISDGIRIVSPTDLRAAAA